MNRRALGLLVLLALAAFALPALYAPPGPVNDFHFSIIGDRTGRATPEVWGRVWREVSLLGPDFVINVGDTIQGGADELVERQWDEIAPVFGRYRDLPLYFTPGNHDIFSDFSEKVYTKRTGRPPHYSFDFQNAHFTVLDNSRTSDLSEEQLDFLERDLKEHQARSPKFIFVHKPYWMIPLKLQSGEFRLHQLARRYGVAYVVSGHGHRLVRMERDGIQYLMVASSGANIEAQRNNPEGFRSGYLYHHVWVRVKGSSARFTVKELDGPYGKGRMFPLEAWGESGPLFDPEDPAAYDKPET